MKTFFTITASIFLGVVIAIMIAGYIISDNKKTKESYTKQTQARLMQVVSSLGDSQQTLSDLEDKVKSLEDESAALEKVTKKVSTTKSTTKSTAPTKQTSSPTTTTKTTSTGTTLTSALVATHSSQSDCWIIVSGKVYSVSSYINLHPGGRSVITNMCGKDATTAFTTKGGLGTHSSAAWSTLGGFLVGALGSSINL